MAGESDRLEPDRPPWIERPRRGLTTNELIERLRAVDPTGERVVFMEIIAGLNGERVETDGVWTVAPENAVRDHDRVVLTNVKMFGDE